MIGWENYEEYMMLHADGELTPAGEQELMAFVSKHPQLKSEFAAFARARLTPDVQEVFTGKETLLKPVPAKRITFVPALRKYGIAAGIAAIAVISFLKLNDNGGYKTEVYATKQNNVQQNSTQPQSTHPVNTIVPSVAAGVIIKAGSIQSDIKDDAVNVNKKTGIALPKSAGRQEEKIVKLAIGKQEMPVGPGVSPISATLTVPEYAWVSESGEKHFWDNLPVDEANKKELGSLNDIAKAVANAYDKIDVAKQSLYNKSVTIKIEKRKLIVSF